MSNSATNADLRRVVSGGQTGADRGGLDAALALGLPVGGWAPLGFRAEDGRIPAIYAKHMHEAPSSSYYERTRLNVRDSHGTLVLSFAEHLLGGSAQTLREARRIGRPCHHLWLSRIGQIGQIDPIAETLAWLRRREILILNVAGPRESKEPGIRDAVQAAMTRVLRDWAGIP